MPELLAGLDLGQSHDYTGLLVVQHDAPRFDVRWIERFPLGTPYPDMVQRVVRLLHTAPLNGRAPLIVDRTGVGAAVVDMFARAYPRHTRSVTITGGDVVGWSPDEPDRYRVPKRDLVGAVQAPLQSGTLKFAAALRETKQLTHELTQFRATISVSGHDSYEAWRERDHDDLVLALALVLWWAQTGSRFDLTPAYTGIGAGVQPPTVRGRR